jgi:hypothetical protein
VRQAVTNHRVIPVDERAKPVVVPHHIAVRTSLVLGLEHKAQPGVAALVLDAGQSAAPALEAHAAGFAYTHAVESAIGAGRQRLGKYGIQVLGQPRDPQRAGELVKGVLGKAVALPQSREGSPPLLLACPGDSARLLPGWVGSHAPQAVLPRGEHGVVELPPGFQVAAQASGLPRLDRQGQFEQKRWRLRLRRRALPSVLATHRPRSFLHLECPFQS